MPDGDNPMPQHTFCERGRERESGRGGKWEEREKTISGYSKSSKF